ncbi:MAG TPA: sugar ABC transporter ATP-binding protein [Trueperaceae bacterium]|nr:sugar ABC transporter ATP-binding protein [Trueperaceae bacterium]
MISVGFEGIGKDFGAGPVLDDVSFTVDAGEIHALVGENGAGKSTLMKILAGYLPATSGRVLLGGVPTEFRDQREAEAEGVVLIHQELNLVEDLTVADNIFLGRERRRRGFLDERAMHREAGALLRRVGLDVDPWTRVRTLIVAQKQLLEIAKALARNAGLLIMDEPTASLTPAEVERLFGLIRDLNGRGVTILYISHKLEEVLALAERVTVLRDGRYVETVRAGASSRQALANLMVGREIAAMFPEKLLQDRGSPLWRVRDVGVPGWAQRVSFDLQRGEILGFAGLVGAGRTELFEGILGLRPRSGGHFELEGRRLRIHHPADAVRAGIVYLSEDRKGKGLHLRLGLAPNLTLMALHRYARPLLRRDRERAALGDAMRRYNIRAGSPEAVAGTLSGGNQQKLALAKVLHTEPKVLVLDEPTRGVDVGAKQEIYRLIQHLAAQGLGIVVVSSELVELIGIAHRLIVMRGGRVTGELGGEGLSEAEVIAYATGVKETHAA